MCYIIFSFRQNNISYNRLQLYLTEKLDKGIKEKR
jgi:hypothetical protein